VVVVTVCRCGELEGSVTDIVEGFIVDTESLVRVLHKLVDRESSVVWLDDGVGDLVALG
jgi:hypothetical protein